MSNKRASCPYCRKEPRYTHYINAMSDGHVVHCDNFSGCTAQPRCAANTEAEVWIAWNRRHVCEDWGFVCNTCDHKCGIELIESEAKE